MLRDWLVSIRPDGPWPEMAEAAEGKEIMEDEEATALRRKLAAFGLDDDRQRLLFDLGQYHARERKPAYWAIHDSLAMEAEDLVDAMDGIGGLEPLGPAEPVKSSMQRRFRFPPQDSRLKPGDQPSVGYDEQGHIATATLTSLDHEAGELVVKVGNRRADLLEGLTALHPPKPLGVGVIEAALAEVTDDQCGARDLAAADQLLARAAPRFAAGSRADVLQGADPVSGTVAAVLDLDRGVLPIKGPPGTGKTHTAARAILGLVRKGRRVAVTSNSHEAVRNLLMAVIAAHEFDDPDFTVAHKIGSEDSYPAACPVVRCIANDDAALGAADVVGGTAWFLCREENRGAFDTLFIDEAGQVGLADALALSTTARNLVLVGDPRQLAQVVQGSHPHPAGLSCLDWLLGEGHTIRPDRGIFLPESRRMHPDVCRFISERFYDGRLDSHPSTASQEVRATGWPVAGVHFVPVPDEGNSQNAPEEVAAIAGAVRDLLGGRWTDRDGVVRPIRHEDIIVVAPYNVQVNALRRALPAAIRVGTVDKFQGQEAPVCLISMTASSAGEVPRGLEFLLSPQRINVAVSRAKALALVFASPGLLSATCSTVEEMALANTLCALAETSMIGRNPPLEDAA